MKRLNGYRMRLMFVGIAAIMALGGGSANADFTFGEPVNLGPPVSSPYGDGITCITADGLEMYLSCYNRPGGLGGWDIWVSRRETINDDWGEPEDIGAPINTAQSDSHAYLSPDGLEMYFTAENRPGGYGYIDIWVTRRGTRRDSWVQPENLGPVVNSSAYEDAPRISTDGLELYFSSDRPGGYGIEDIWVTKRATKNDPWAEPVNLGSTVNSSTDEDFPFLSSDGLLLFFSADKDTVGPLQPGGYGGLDMWMARRASVSDPWGTPVNLGPMVNSSSLDCSATLSPDGHALYFTSDRPGGLGGPYGDIYQAPILPIVDFNGDGIVDTADMCIIVDHWGEDYSLCDIGPMPWGDGVVDVQDLIVLSEHLFEDVNDPTLIAHWPLDEAQGVIAYDSASDCDGTLIGGPVWQPDGGIVAGALQFDGIDDYVMTTDRVLNPADGTFSVVAWVMGGAPGQAVLSQADGSNWLCLDSIEGCLMTELKASGRGAAGPLLSEAIITDGDWHRIGLAWDGSYRRLYVDGAEVAKDAAPLSSLEDAYGGLYFGVGSDLAPGTFFSGLIDDVRIYNRVVPP